MVAGWMVQMALRMDCRLSIAGANEVKLFFIGLPPKPLHSVKVSHSPGEIRSHISQILEESANMLLDNYKLFLQFITPN